MFKAIAHWWNKDKLELELALKIANERLNTEMSQCDKLRVKLDETLEDAKVLAAEVQRLKALNPDMKAEGVLTPWMIIGVDGENELKGLKIFMDWNDAVIQHMKDKNLGYQTEDEMIQHFLVQLYEHVLMVLERRVLDDSDLHRPNEFE